MRVADVKPGDVFYYTPRSRWCLHGIYVAFERPGGIAVVDTYSMGLKGNPYNWEAFKTCTDELLAGCEYVGNIDEFEQVDEHDYNCYDIEDTITVPMGCRSAERWARKSGARSVSREREQFKWEVERLEFDLSLARSRLDAKQAEFEQWERSIQD